MYIYEKLSHFAVQQKLTQHCKSTILKFKKIKWKIQGFLLKKQAFQDGDHRALHQPRPSCTPMKAAPFIRECLNSIFL